MFPLQNSPEIPISKYKSFPIKHKICHNNLIETKNNIKIKRHRQQKLYETVTFRIIFSNRKAYYKKASCFFEKCSKGSQN